MSVVVVAIDGPAGAGKSTVARLVAGRLGMAYLDTGALYRAVALAALDRAVDPADGPAAADLAGRADIHLRGDRILLDGRDVSERIREDDVSAASASVAAHPGVRRVLLERQREVAAGQDVVMEGRDIATAVVPGAEVKIYLTASVEERARRRALQLGLPEDPATLTKVAASIAQRDLLDAGRAASPLRRAPDAIEVDTTDLSLDEVVARIVSLVEEAGRGDG